MLGELGRKHVRLRHILRGSRDTELKTLVRADVRA